MPATSIAIRISSRPASACLVAAVLLLPGCIRHEVIHYTPISWELDGKSELHISSYPSWFPRETQTIPFLYKHLRTPDSIYFQLFVRDAKVRFGPNPHIKSIRVRSFSYQLAGQAPVQLISDLDKGFWMQGDEGAEGKLPPVPCTVGVPISVSVSLELNGEAYQFDGETTCAVRKGSGLLLVHEMSR